MRQPDLQGGKHTSWSKIERPSDQPLITIITSTLNAAEDLPWTIDSIRKQTYPYVQWIVADGASKDRTVKLLKRNEDLIDIWFSEPDSGIYDAWNKALTYAKGEWVQFIGAGDELAEPNTLELIAPILATAHPNHDLVYGRLQFLSRKNRVILEEVGEPWETMKGQWEFFKPKLPVHPGVFHHYSIMEGDGTFDARYKIAGDSHFLMKHINNKDMLYVPLVIDKMPIGGLSGALDHVYATSIEVRRATKELGIKAPLGHVLHEHIKLQGKRIVVSVLPMRLVFLIADLYRIVVGKKRRWRS
jgi:glycosyltransferase involved in cell wall biosynthesis